MMGVREALLMTYVEWKEVLLGARPCEAGSLHGVSGHSVLVFRVREDPKT